MSKTVRVTITLDASAIELAERLRPVLEGDLRYAPHGRLSQAAVLRLAVSEGLRRLQRRHAETLRDSE